MPPGCVSPASIADYIRLRFEGGYPANGAMQPTLCKVAVVRIGCPVNSLPARDVHPLLRRTASQPATITSTQRSQLPYTDRYIHDTRESGLSPPADTARNLRPPFPHPPFLPFPLRSRHSPFVALEGRCGGALNRLFRPGCRPCVPSTCSECRGTLCLEFTASSTFFPISTFGRPSLARSGSVVPICITQFNTNVPLNR